MFQSPVYQWWAGSADEADGTSGFGFPEGLAGLSDATAVDDPILQRDVSDGDGDTFDAGEYDATGDWHDASSTLDSQLPTGSDAVSIAALVYVNSSTTSDPIVDYGAGNNGEEVLLIANDSGGIQFAVGGGSYLDAGGGSYQTGQWITVGGATGGADGSAYLNGSEAGSST